MHKIIYIDVGTHYAQEFKSFFGSEIYFFTKIIKRFISFYLLRRGEVFSFNKLKELIYQRRDLRKKKNSFICFFVEANSMVIQHSSAYKLANGVFNCALTGDKQVSLINLYLANNNKLDQGSSIFSDKKDVSINQTVLTLGVPADLFFKSLKDLIELSISEYSVILRLNCEGVEDSVIYAAHKIFSKRLSLVMGSLKDVQEYKGDEAFNSLQDYLSVNKLTFVFFSESINSWSIAHKSINEVSKIIDK